MIVLTKAKTWCKLSDFPSDSNLTWNLMRCDKALEPLVKLIFHFSNYQCLFLDMLVVPSSLLLFFWINIYEPYHICQCGNISCIML